MICGLGLPQSKILATPMEVCNEFARPIIALLGPGNTASFEDMLQRRRAVGNTVSNTTGPRFECQITVPETNALSLDQPAGTTS